MLHTVYKGKSPTEFVNVPLFGVDSETLRAALKINCLNQNGIEIVSNLLRTISKTKNIQYCPMLPFVASMLVMFLEEREAYKVLDYMIDDSLSLQVKNA